jgi:hypothetical protein
MSACRSCKAPLLWATSEANRKPIPLDRDPNPEGNVVLVDASFTRGAVHISEKVARVLGPLELAALDAGTNRFMPHHATCPNVKDFRR